MNEEQEKLLSEYKDELLLLGKDITNISTIKVIFFNFLNDKEIDLLRLKIGQAEQFQTYLVSLNNDKEQIRYSKNSVLNIISYVKSFYNFLKRKKYILTNPFNNLRRSRHSKSLPKNILNEDDMNKLLTGFTDYMRGKNLRFKRRLYKAHVICELMYSTGARINEIVKLKEEDIDFKRGTVTLNDSKTKRIRTGILNEYALNVLKYYIEIKGMVLDIKGNISLLFGSKYNLKIWLNEILKEECVRLKLTKISSHYFRHAVGYHLLRSGCDIRYIQAILGHKKLTTTAIYTKIDKEDLRNILDKYHPRQFGVKKNDE